MQLYHLSDFVGLGAGSEGREEATDILPAGFAQEGCSRGIVRAQEGEEEGVEVVGGGGEVEPGWGEEGVDVFVEGGHSSCRWNWGLVNVL